jgi:hypothetical protein
MMGARRTRTTMVKRRRHSREQVIRKLREGERLLGEGQELSAVCKHLEVTEQTWTRWRNQYGGVKADDAKRLKELEKQNQRLKKIVADQALDLDMLKELSRGALLSPQRRRRAVDRLVELFGGIPTPRLPAGRSAPPPNGCPVRLYEGRRLVTPVVSRDAGGWSPAAL